MPRYRTTGYTQDTDRFSGRIVSGETFTCCHCPRIVTFDIKESPAMCHSCWAPVCAKCHAYGKCRPYEKRLLQLESQVTASLDRDRFHRQLGV